MLNYYYVTIPIDILRTIVLILIFIYFNLLISVIKYIKTVILIFIFIIIKIINCF